MKITKEFKNYIKTNYPLQTGLYNKILRKKSIPIEKITDEIKHFVDILNTSMQIYDGIWLAAPQIGKNIRVIAVCQLNKKQDTIISSQVMINPEITEKSSKTFIENEWCLSLPWMEWKVERYYKIKVKYENIDWKQYNIYFTWLNAWIIQHEIDHLDGILFWDKVIEKDKKIDFKKFIKL